MPRTIGEISLPGQTPSGLWPVLTSWLANNGFTILTTKADGNQQAISHWDGSLLLRPREGSCVALRQMTGGGTIVLETSMSEVGPGVRVHLEGYVTGRGPGWQGKEYDFIPKSLAVAGVLRKRGLLLFENLQGTLSAAAARAASPVGPLQLTAPAQGVPGSTTCVRCGALLPPIARVCPNCGTRSLEASSPTLNPRPRAVGGSLPAAPLPAPALAGAALAGPSVPLVPGEVLVARYASSLTGQSRVMTLNALLLLGLVGALVVPVAVFSVLADGLQPPVLLFLVVPTVVGGTSMAARRTIRRRGPTAVFVTDRRVLVDQPGKDGSTSVMNLENIGRVEVNAAAFAARRAGVAWVYVLPTGTRTAMVGAGRSRHAAPGVLWIPAVPLEQANELRSLLLARARDVQARLGYAPAVMAQ